MTVKLYKDNGLYYFQNRVHPSGTCFLEIEADGKLNIRNVNDSQYIISAQPVTDFIDKFNVPYADFITFISAVGDFFTSIQTSPATINVNVASINGKIPGSFFGDNNVSTQRTPVCAAKWSQGLPAFRSKITYTGDGGEWGVVTDPNDSNYLDGACYFSTLTGAGRGIFWSSAAHNRYLPGHLSFFGYTFSWHNLETANGSYIALVGAFSRGAESLGNSNVIKEAICWGYVSDATGEPKLVLRVYKNYGIVLEKEITNIGINFEDLNIFEQQIGYYGIHPSLIWWFDSLNKTHKLLDYTAFNQAFTSVADPNLAVGVYLQNITNTAPIQIRNGSVEFGNYNTRTEPFDASGRLCVDATSIPSLAADPIDTDGSGFVAAYKVVDVFNAASKINKIGSTNSNFESQIANQLLTISAAGASNRTLSLNVWFVPAADVTATFTAINPGENVLHKATAAAVIFTRGRLLARFPMTATGQIINVSDLRYLLSNGTVAVLTVTASQAATVTDIVVIINTRDLS